MIKILLSTLLDDFGMTQKELSDITGIRPATINKMYHEKLERIILDHIDLICEKLDCEVSDLMQRIPDKEYYKYHPKPEKR